jgi:hypothetical protein
MRALPHAQLLANPGLPGFARFGGRGFAQSRLLRGTAPGRALRESRPENFPAGKFSIARLAGLAGLLIGNHCPSFATCKTFLQESFYTRVAGGNFESAKRNHRGGRVMPTTQ